MPWPHSGPAGSSGSSSDGPSLEAVLEGAMEGGDIYTEDCSSNIYPKRRIFTVETITLLGFSRTS